MQDPMRKILVFKYFFLVILAMLVVACGGGGAGAGSTGGGSTSTSSSGVAGPQITAIATGTYILSWNAVPDPAVNSYRVYFATGPFSSGKILGQLDTAATSLEFLPGSHGIAAGATLYMAVSALGANGLESPVSNQLSIVVQ